MIRVSPRARRREDRAGDPLDGLVNMFDVGIVLAVAFLLGGLKAAEAGGKDSSTSGRIPKDALVVKPGEELKTLSPSDAKVVGRGAEVGSVYRLSDGRLVYVTKKP